MPVPWRPVATRNVVFLLVAIVGLLLAPIAMASPPQQPESPRQPPESAGSPSQPDRPQPPVETGGILGLAGPERPRPPITTATVGPLVIRLSPAPSRANEAARQVAPPQVPPTDEKWIDVDLSDQAVVAYEGTTPVASFVVSSGLPRTPTVTGAFRIWAKTPLQDMEGGSPALGNYYNLKNVPWVQYFYADYSFHGTYWHENFGQPMSHGCINMRIEDAKWLFDWTSPAAGPQSRWVRSSAAQPGTLVVVHD